MTDLKSGWLIDQLKWSKEQVKGWPEWKKEPFFQSNKSNKGKP